MKIYMVEVGVKQDESNRIPKKEEDFYFLYPENTLAFVDRNDALKFIDEYVEKGNVGTYGFAWEISRTIEEYQYDDLFNSKYLADEFYESSYFDDVFYAKGLCEEEVIKKPLEVGE